MPDSKHLTEIVEQHNRIANMQVVFVDVSKYSQRRTLTQIQVVDALTTCLKTSLASVSQYFIQYAQANSLNFQTDIIRLPTGDGAALVFTFDGLHDIHLEFAKQFLKAVYDHNQKQQCAKFTSDGWCNCHPNFHVRIGVSEGKGIIFTDMNGVFNVAGGVVNMAARVMGHADQDQIIFTEESYRLIIDMVDDPKLIDHFVEFPNVNIKHGIKVSVYQFTDKSLPYVNSSPPEDLSFIVKGRTALKSIAAAGLGMDPDAMEALGGADKVAMLRQIEMMAELAKKMIAPGLDLTKLVSRIDEESPPDEPAK